MKKKLILQIALVIILIITAVLLFQRNFNSKIVYCSEYDQRYFEWFPYSENDTLVFSNNGLEKAYIIKNYSPIHTSRYNRKAKCGCCEDKIQFELAGKIDTFSIYLENYYSSSCLGFSFGINSFSVYDEEIIRDTIINQRKFKKIDFQDFLILKDSGVVRMAINDTIWELKNHIHSNEKAEIKIENGW
jgi:hypothetical protein